jgi:hypothetical protein
MLHFSEAKLNATNKIPRFIMILKGHRESLYSEYKQKMFEDCIFRYIFKFIY